MSRPKLTDIVSELPSFVPFVGPEAHERMLGRAFRARLGANESVFGPSPKAVAAMAAAASENWMYGDPENYELRNAIAAHHGIAIDHVVVGEGIDGLLGLTVKMFAQPGDVVVTSDGAYPTFNYHVAGHGARLVKVAFNGTHEDLQGLAAAAHKHAAKIVYVSNPNNPMGTWWSAPDIAALQATLPCETLLVLDEAYADTAPDDAVPPINAHDPAVIRYRTFSKAYGLAGARIGYAIADQTFIAAFDKVRNHYGINRVGQMGALAALNDQSYLAAVVKKMSDARQRLYATASDVGLSAVPSAANFVAIDCGSAARAEQVLAGLTDAGIFVRRPPVAPLDRHVRVSCSIPADLDLFADAMTQIMSRL